MIKKSCDVGYWHKADIGVQVKIYALLEQQVGLGVSS